MDILKDKTKLIKFLLQTLDESEKTKNGLLKLSESLTREEPNLTLENIAKCLALTMRDTAKQSHVIQSLATIALIQCSSSNFDTDVALVINKLGMGQEALQQMLKNKMAGK